MLNYRLLLCMGLFIAGCAFLGFARLDIDTDVVRSLPVKERVVSDGLAIFEHHPIHDQIAVDIRLDVDDRDALVDCGAFVERQLTASGLFSQVGSEAMGQLLPGVALQVVRTLPLLFSSNELDELLPLLDPARIERQLTRVYAELGSLEGVGQAAFIAADPLGLRKQVLAKMQLLAPSAEVTLYRGSLLSADGRHLLVTGRPLTAGTDTGFARKLDEAFQQTARELNTYLKGRNLEATLTPVGAYRAALDNERIIRSDVRLALLLATAGIALLLLFSFPRPLFGLLSLVPALAGTAAALLVYSLFFPSISIIVLGFGGAIISITVDHGIAYLLFLDRAHATRGKEASHEVKSIGLMAVVTTVYAFLILSLSGFAIFTQLGIFTAMGLLFSFLFIHSVFPRIFPAVAAGSDRRLPLQDLVDRLYATGRIGVAAALILAMLLLPFATPRFAVSLSSMNTVTPATEAADALITEVWGQLGDRVFLMQSAATTTELQQGNDRLLARLEKDMAHGVLAAAFVPSMLFPGTERAGQNLAAWHAFWNSERTGSVRAALAAAGRKLGFTEAAFAPFLAMLEPAFALPTPELSPEYFPLLGISASGGELIQFITVVPGEKYDPGQFMTAHPASRIFDASYFSQRLAALLFSTFSSMLLIVGVSIAILLLLAYLDLRLTLLTLLPAAFAFICTLGTLRLLGHPLDIPALMLSIVILGMGIDYAIFCVRAHQRYRVIDHPSYGKVRCAVLLSGGSTMIGFGVLCFAEHSLLRSIGLTSLLGIGFSLAGTFLLLPPMLARTFAGAGSGKGSRKGNLEARIRRRYLTLEAYPRMFARFKLRLDPMFADLPRMLAHTAKVATIIDIGCGYGVPACWCLETFPDARILAIDPDPERVSIASLAFGERGKARQGWAPDMPDMDGQAADVVLLLDMLHYVDDTTVGALLVKARTVLNAEGILIARFSIRPPGRPSWAWRLEDARIRLAGRRAWYRRPDELISMATAAGYTILVNEPSSRNPELIWLVAKAG